MHRQCHGTESAPRCRAARSSRPRPSNLGTREMLCGVAASPGGKPVTSPRGSGGGAPPSRQSMCGTVRHRQPRWKGWQHRWRCSSQSGHSPPAITISAAATQTVRVTGGHPEGEQGGVERGIDAWPVRPAVTRRWLASSVVSAGRNTSAAAAGTPAAVIARQPRAREPAARSAHGRPGPTRPSRASAGTRLAPGGRPSPAFRAPRTGARPPGRSRAWRRPGSA
jgi:hypothetical protein